MRPIGILACSWLLLLTQLDAAAQEYNPARRLPVTSNEPAEHRYIVKFRDSASIAGARAKPSGDAVRQLATRMNLKVMQSWSINGDLHVMHVAPPAGESVATTLSRLRADSSIEYVEPDRRRYLHATANDERGNGQWYLKNAQPSAVNAEAAWDITTGNGGVVIAVLDTGIRFDHPDLRSVNGNRLLPGYDFISADPDGSFFTANDGDGRDPDPSDPGDWVSSADSAARGGCVVGDSSWHGTRVAGIIGALTNNGTGVSGLTWSGYILPVRVIGKCGGYDSDILAAMRWAAGLSVPGVPDNPYPARIINLSLGGLGGCSPITQAVVDELTARGVLIVASAGNEGGPVSAPANCDGVAAILGLRHAGTKVGFSSLGPEIAVGAPGGNCVDTRPGQPCQFSIDTTSNDGTTVPGGHTYTDKLNFNVGTSFSAPIVSGIAGLMLAANGGLSSQQLLERLKAGAKPYPVSSDPGVPQCRIPQGFFDLQQTECTCNTLACGAGMANAEGALREALRPIAAIAVSPTSVAPGQTVTLKASGSAAACGRSVTSYSWTVANDGGNAPVIAGADTDTATVTAPPSGSFTIRLTVTDNMGQTDSALVVVTSNAASTTAPASVTPQTCLTPVSYTPPPVAEQPPPTAPTVPDSGGGGGGGGALEWLSLLISAMTVGMMLTYRLRRRSAVSSQTF